MQQWQEAKYTLIQSSGTFTISGVIPLPPQGGYPLVGSLFIGAGIGKSGYSYGLTADVYYDELTNYGPINGLASFGGGNSPPTLAGLGISIYFDGSSATWKMDVASSYFNSYTFVDVRVMHKLFKI